MNRERQNTDEQPYLKMSRCHYSDGVSKFKVHDYRLVFFWSLVLGVQTPEDGTTGGRSFCDWNSG